MDVDTTLPGGWAVRPTTLDDVPALLALTEASDEAYLGEADTSVEEIRETLVAKHTGSWLVTDPTGTAVGWGSLENQAAADREHLGVYAWPGRGEPAMRPLVDLMLARVAVRAREFGHARVTVRSGVLPVEKELAAVLTAAGFGFHSRHARMRIALRGDETAPVPPAGVTLERVGPPDEPTLRTCFALKAEAFEDTDHREYRDFDGWLAALQARSSVPWDEWRLARVDGVPAGVLFSTNQQLEQDEGWVGALAVARGYRGRGLGRLLLRTAFAQYAAKGRTSAGLGVDMTNPTGAYGLYLSVGMTPVYEADVYQLELPAALA
ncbi:MAG TPA: GNAT family N-acetyltransferase [Rugosimonospora sp.]|nr:GNAT family N-acetyltransferase [Rugosimonospora sp.]